MDSKPTKILNKNPLAHLEERKREHNNKKKMEVEIKPVFEMKIHKKKEKLKDSETELRKRYDKNK